MTAIDPPAVTQPKKVLALDYGRSRIGIASGNTLTRTATPLETITYTHPQLPWSTLDGLLRDWAPAELLLGIPRLDTGESSALEKEIIAFAKQLESRYQLPVTLINEAFSSFEANERLKSQRRQGRRKKVAKAEIDRQAAAIIIEQWLRSGGE